MLKLVRFLRPFIFSIVLIFALLFIQAMSDLALPDYMSRIVNVGIQQNGLTSPVPEVVRASSMDKLALLMDPADFTSLKAHYRLLSKNDLPAGDYGTLAKKYPALATEDLYQLDTTSGAISAALELALAKGLATMALIDSGKLGSMTANLPAGMSIYQVLAQMPAAQRSQLLAQGAEKMGAIPDSMIKQSAIATVTAEYEAIGVNKMRIQSNYILMTGLLMLLLALLGTACSITVGLLGSRVAAGAARDMRNAAFSKVEGFSSAEFDTFSTASLITRSTNDIQTIQMTLVMMMRILFYAPILGVGGILKVVRSESGMTWIIAVAVAALMTLIITLFVLAVPRFKLIQKLIDRINLVTREILSGLMVIRAFDTHAHEEKKFDVANRDVTKLNLFVNRLMVLMMPMMMMIMNGISLLIIWVGAHEVDQGNMQIGDVMAFIQYTMQIIMSFLMVSMVFIMMPRASVSGQRIAEILAVKPRIVDPEKPLQFPADGRGEIEFRDVQFRYPGADDDVLSQISFTAKPGQTTAIIGSTGCGKSTLVNLVPRFYDVTAGQVLIDGIDIRQVTQSNLRERIGYVAQKGVLFSGSIEDNIRYGRDNATDGEVRAAATTAQALDFIDASEEGFATPISQGGTNVSGGQKQRLSIARAIVKKPPIFIFDDTFSALDYKTDAALRQALAAETGHSTVMIVAQRIGTIRHAEQIIVLDEGRIVGIGTHEQLLTDCAVYREIALSQLSEEELVL
jgi:ATP-binding cassette, subfamily B, multidrug efflux pump